MSVGLLTLVHTSCVGAFTRTAIRGKNRLISRVRGGRGRGTAIARGRAMKSYLVFAASLTLLALSSGCSSASTDNAAPVIDSLDVPATTSTLTVNGQSGPGVVMTLTAHDDTAGLTALHVLFTETGSDHTIDIPNAPTKLTGQKIEFVVLNAPKGQHALEFHLTDTKGHTSAIVDKTITVP